MKKIVNLCLVITVVLLTVSCSSSKNVAYFQNSDSVSFDTSQELYDAQIMPKDVLTITVNTVNPEASAPFNLVVSTELRTGVAGQSLGSQRALQTYLVSNDGTI